MPELPEVEVIKIGLNKLLIGQDINSVKHDWVKSFPNAAQDVNNFLIGATVKSIKRRAKVLIIGLSTGYSLVIHLKMTGQLVYVSGKSRFGGGHPSISLGGQLPDSSTRVIFGFAGGGKLYFNDQRKFGWVRLIPTAEVPNIDFFKTVGPEPLAPSFTKRKFKERLQKRPNSVIKAVLLDQKVIAGVGNIYADESLWGAKIHPETPVNKLKNGDIEKLFDEIRTVLNLSIKKGGSTDKNYVDAEGKKGSYLEFARVFRREGSPCPRCSNEIIKTRVAGRGTHICPYCQQRVS